MSVDTQRVTLTVPAVPEYLRLARMASADAASRAGFDYEEIDDLRIAVSELCHLLIGTGGGGVLSLELSVADHGVTIDGHVTAPGASVENEFSSAILATVVDEYTLSDGDDGRRFHVVKTPRR